MRIAYIIPSLYRMAPNRVVQQLVEGMMARGHECNVFYFDPVTTDAIAFPCRATRISLLRATTWCMRMVFAPTFTFGSMACRGA